MYVTKVSIPYGDGRDGISSSYAWRVFLHAVESLAFVDGSVPFNVCVRARAEGMWIFVIIYSIYIIFIVDALNTLTAETFF